ncbi:FAD-dependent oxidoreductase [Brachybacterium sp. GCM10030267]|uniref:FAD-dependent oxidoreductase n=1 Tax=Brachybacterium sp. GCM10030267 TaxID=3273381 RepID=UPI00361E7201
MTSLWLDTHDPSRVPVSAMPAGISYDVAVAGAGLTGLATAVALARTGRRVIVLEARTVGAVATGNTTGKVSLLQSTRLSRIRRRTSLEAAAAYLAANRDGQNWLLELCAQHDVPFQRRTAYSYASTDAGTAQLREELETAQELGLDLQWQETSELALPMAGAVALADQAQFDAMDVLTALARELRGLGGVIVEGVRLTGASRRGPLRLSTTGGEVRADRLVLATGSPVLDRGGHSLRMVPQRSYALAYRVPEHRQVPSGMYISVDGPTRSIRSAPHGGEELLLVGGNGHVTGRTDSHAARIAELDEWALRLVPGAQRTHTWAAQDYESASGLPLIGALPGSDGTILAATGYAKWGMTNAAAAALAMTGVIEGRTPVWFEVLRSAGGGFGALAAEASMGAQVGKELVQGWVGAELTQLPTGPSGPLQPAAPARAVEPTDVPGADDPGADVTEADVPGADATEADVTGAAATPPEGRGVVGRWRGRPVGVSTVEGRTCAVSGVCTHMGGVLRWNDAEPSWDCPLHGSRFAPDGGLLEGPAVKDLDRVPDSDT